MKRKSEEPVTDSNAKRLRSEELGSVEESEEDVLQDNSPSKHRSSQRSLRDDVPNKINGVGTADGAGEQPLEGEAEDTIEVQTPKKRGRPKGSKNTPRGNTTTPVKSKGGLFSTPNKAADLQNGGNSSPIPRNADRSARRKSARAIIERSIGDNISDGEDDELARDIYDFENGTEYDEDLEDPGELAEASAVPATPSKRGRGRPKGSKTRKRSPTPPRDLPPHELYFSQNKSVQSKTSNNTLANLQLLTHEEYFTLIRSHTDHHAKDLTFLHDLHSRSFNQWSFELSQNFSLLLHGFGSKRSLVHSFATHLSDAPSFDSLTQKIVITNGYLPNASIRDILTTISRALTSTPQKLGSQPTEMLESVLTLLDDHPDQKIYLLINSLDSPALRRAHTQNLLARLSTHPRLHLLATTSHPNVALLWDSSLRSTFNFVFHDCTTFQPYDIEIDVVDEVHALLGRSGRRVGGKEGVAFVLKSLPVKARQLFGVLVSEQLAGMDENMDPFSVDDFDDEDDHIDDDFGQVTRKMASVSGGKREPGVEYRVLYQKAVEDFICPNEMTFRTLLKE